MSAKFCEECGEKLPPDSVYCETCGAKVGQNISSDTLKQSPFPEADSSGNFEKTPWDSSETSSSGKDRSKMGIIMGSAVLIIALIAVLWSTGVIGNKRKPSVAVDSEGKSGSKNVSEMTSHQNSLPKPSQNSEKKTETQKMPTVTEEHTEERNEETKSPTTETPQLSTTEIPTPEDFIWFTGNAENWVMGIIPEKGEPIEKYDNVKGSWKGLQIAYENDGTVLGFAYGTVTFSESEPNLSAVFRWHYLDWNNGPREDLSGSEVETMVGSFDSPNIILGDPGNQINLLFYEMEGKQYAEGLWSVESGEEIRIALVRP